LVRSSRRKPATSDSLFDAADHIFSFMAAFKGSFNLPPV
jgi:hypothetical protein